MKYIMYFLLLTLVLMNIAGLIIYNSLNEQWRANVLILCAWHLIGLCVLISKKLSK